MGSRRAGLKLGCMPFQAVVLIHPFYSMGNKYGRRAALAPDATAKVSEALPPLDATNVALFPSMFPSMQAPGFGLL